MAQDLVLPPSSTLPTVNTENIGQSNTLHTHSLHWVATLAPLYSTTRFTKHFWCGGEVSSVGSSFPQNTPKHSWVMQCVSGTTLNASRRTLWRIVQRITRRLLLKKTDCFDDGSRWSQGTYITRDYRDYCDGHVQKDVELPVKHSFGAPCSLGTEGHPLRFSHAK